MVEAGGLAVIVKWGGKALTVELGADEQTVEALQAALERLTGVRAERQKLLGLKGAKPGAADPTARLADVLPCGKPLTLIGTAEAAIQALVQQTEIAPEVVDDLGTDFDTTDVDIADRPEVQEKLARRIASVNNIKILNPPRPGKRALVLDVDYCLYDLGSPAEVAHELARPYLHEFLSAAYVHYDIVIWSATSLKWIEVKMKELGVSTHPAYKLTAMMDHLSMITVQHEKYGVFNCKPLAVLWAKFPEYTPANTIMFDDLRRNYVLNKQNGLVIRPWRKAHRNRARDRELVHLSRYLERIAALPSLEGLDHDRWEDYISRKRKAAPEPEPAAEPGSGGDGAAAGSSGGA